MYDRVPDLERAKKEARRHSWLSTSRRRRAYHGQRARCRLDKAREAILLCAAAVLCACHAVTPRSSGVSGREIATAASPSVDRETTREKLERLVQIPGKERTDVEWLMTMRAHQTLRALGKPGFDDFVACVDDPRPVWPELSLRRAGPTSLGETCLMLITEHVDALYRDEGGLDFVTAHNAREWWQSRREVPLADLQMEALQALRSREAERAEGSPPEVRAYIEGRILNDLDLRIAKARRQREFGFGFTLTSRYQGR